jgi:hypothetical protein
MERYQTHTFGKDRAMTVEEAINELIAPNRYNSAEKPWRRKNAICT